MEMQGDKPYWLATRTRRATAPPPLAATNEVVIVGGGIMGVATAYWLSRLGLATLLIEAGDLADGASGRNAGLMLAGSGPLEAPKLVRTVLATEGIDAEYATPGHLALAQSAEIWEKICAEAERRRTSANPVFALDHAACEELLSMRISPTYIGGRWYPQGGVIHPLRFIEGLTRAAQRYGATIITQTRVLHVTAHEDQSEIETTRGSVCARHVVFACGLQVQSFVPALAHAITPVRGQMLATVPLPRLFNLGMAVDWGTLYWRQAADGAILLGGYRGLDAPNESSARPRLNGRIQQALAEFLPQAFPDLPPIHIQRRWAGIMDSTADGVPLIGISPGAPNHWIIAGFGGHGLPVALGASQALAAAIVQQQSPADLQPFDPRRLARPVSPRSVPSIPASSSPVA